LTYALIKLEPKDCNSPSKHAMNAEMHKCRSFKIIASRLKRCSSWCCHVYISTNTGASKCSKWSNETKNGIVASLIKFEQFKRGFTTKRAHNKYRQEINLVLHMYAKWTTPNKVHTSCHEANLWFDQIFRYWILSELCSLSQKFVKQMCVGGYRCHQNLTYRSCQAYAKSHQKLKTVISVSITELKFTLKCNRELSRYSDMGQQRPILIFSYLVFQVLAQIQVSQASV
jgi:hypothetical protein